MFLKNLRMKTNNLTILFISVVILSSCVSMRKFNGLKNASEQETDRLKKENLVLSTSNIEYKNQIDLLLLQMKEKSKQIDEALYNIEVEKRKWGVLEKEKNDLQKQFDVLNSGSTKEIEKLMEQLQLVQTDLKRREEKLAKADKELSDKNIKLIELQNALTQKDQAVKELKDKVIAALTGFNNNGLTIQEKNGKVYVSLDEKLLFMTGKWDVDPNGQKALRELANLLALNKDINILVEGHTDDVPMKGTGDVKDNWDLSVMRATAVTKILTQNKQVDPSRITSAGRSEFVPVSPDKTTGGRQMNRRTEIILTPKIDELLKIIGGD
jgi:chemotaxis protein MotB